MAAIFRQILPVLGGSLLGLAAAVALLFSLWQQQEAQLENQLADAWAAAQRSALDHEVQRLDALATALAALPVLASQPLPSTLETLARQHRLAGLRWIAGSALALDEHAVVPINYGVLDLLRRSWAGQKTFPEAYQRDGGWLLYTAALIRDSAGAPLAVLLQASQLQGLLQMLPPLPEGIGQLQLIQAYAGNPPQLLFSQGQGQGRSWEWPTAHPHWQLHFTAGSELVATPPGLPLLLAGLAVVLATLLGALLSVLLQRRVLIRLEAPVLRERGSRPPPPPGAPLDVPDSTNKPALAGDDVFDLSDGK